MTRAATTDLLTGTDAAICAFNVIHLESAEAIAAGAEQAEAPVIMQISENCVKYHGSLAPIARAAMAIAESARVPIAVHLDHATDVDLVTEALELDFDSVMYDGAHLSFAKNCAITAEVVRRAHGRGIGVEAELGEIGGKDGAHAPGVRTDPSAAAEFVTETGVDALAVAIGTSHAMVERTSRLDLELIAELAARLPVPLVLHGSSGVADDEIRRAVAAGMAKINISTHLNKLFSDSVRATLEAHPDMVDSRKYFGPAREVFAAEAARLIGLLCNPLGQDRD
ncbi:class II fructose-bisphosphate aldolase [Brevibacterium sp. BDJS002]|uniref:class II fructose-bisphosphate aldolase n=1 Tax=Brevibacterium sp. BDJS002 TaxID=3020906 RepID=UPI00230801B7|nr:class II fructose-bisphosphate aldolase [Brevibacterium sp. BDJS002]MDN5737198.1 class II fructose-bisphosphate aldolase [Brevibacterium aurantiacum]MDN5772327.1 class II fructose-bisphosphate aldolase [Brevibacterium aurantiacum]MDN5794028.1 class II fructose-bisphosphate aldolase [Brevibacterium aurantiacum]WCE39912.1 class II fructose-bisphosphate aldolase [Brevibacterium sp. BDJS002]